jgi:oxygen-independent coproporphyrinogen-3 oxidase
LPQNVPALSPFAQRLALAERHVPRYTSYPTAPHFSGDVTAHDYEAWLGALSPCSTLSLYLHIPFCASMCYYCGCHTKVTARRAPVDAYLDRLEAEIALVGLRTPARRVTMIHWGGGTPGMAGPEGLRRIHRAITDRFDLSGLSEHAIELDPRTVDDDLIAALAEIGVNRVSLGVQDINMHVQEAIGRVQPLSMVADVMTRLRAAGITAINCDLLYGLPHQSEEDVRRTAKEIAALEPSRIALFGYAHVPWMKTHQKRIDEAALPGLNARLTQAEASRAELNAAGYRSIGLDHFALEDDDMAVAERNGTLRRNFQGYTVDEADALIGLGASSIGRLPQGYVQNAPDFGGYYRAIDAGHLATVRGKALSDDDRLRASMIERLMCDFALDLAAFPAFDASSCGEGLAELQQSGIIRIEGSRLTVSEEARPFVRLVAAQFDAYLEKAGRHSIAV